MLAKMLSLQLGLEGLVGGLGVDGLLLKDGQHTHRLLEELKAGLKVHAEVAGDPHDTFTHVLLLLQNEPEVSLGRDLSKQFSCKHSRDGKFRCKFW